MPSNNPEIVLEPGLALDLIAIERRLAAAFMARYGIDVAADITAETMAWAWEHRARLEQMQNPAGFLFRVGQSKSRRFFRWRREQVRFPDEHARTNAASATAEPWTEPGLPQALASLRPEDRTAVVLVHSFQWTYGEVAELLELPLHTVRNRIHRALARLSTDLGVSS